MNLLAPQRRSVRQLPSFQAPSPPHLNVVIPTITLGGAERIVVETLSVLAAQGRRITLFILHNSASEYPLISPRIEVVRLAKLSIADKCAEISLRVALTGNRIVFAHLLRPTMLASLWQHGIKTIPVVHNSRAAWDYPISELNREHVPVVVSVAEDLRREMESSGLARPVITIRHEITRSVSPGDGDALRDEIRRRHGWSPPTVVVGMIGQFKTQKNYPEAIEVLAALRRHLDARLVILGGWQHRYGDAESEHRKCRERAAALCVEPHVEFLGPVTPSEPYLHAFDVLLNTSHYEGLSIACLEAVQLGCPVVARAVNGQAEIQGEGVVLIPPDAPAADYAQAIVRVVHAGRRPLPAPLPLPDLVPRLWAMTLTAASFERAARDTTLFVTSNLNPGGAQRSLVNLLCHLDGGSRVALCMLYPSITDSFTSIVERRSLRAFTLATQGTILDRAERLLWAARELGVRQIVFWNVEPSIKLIVAKLSAAAGVAVVEVSPGPMLFSEMDQTVAWQQRLAFSARDYYASLALFVAKYEKGQIPSDRGEPRRQVLIRNGVEVPPVAASLAGQAVVTCTRIVPTKGLEILIAAMTLVRQKVPAATFTIVGRSHPQHLSYFERIKQMSEEAGGWIRLAGHDADVFSFLQNYRAFIMHSLDQGCPNASLEAMAAGLPVIANDDGGTGEQVIDGQTGYLVRTGDAATMAARIIDVLTNDRLAKKLGQAARQHAATHFSIPAMVSNYSSALELAPTPLQPT